MYIDSKKKKIKKLTFIENTTKLNKQIIAYPYLFFI